jgi:hypothetical protein
MRRSLLTPSRVLPMAIYTDAIRKERQLESWAELGVEPSNPKNLLTKAVPWRIPSSRILSYSPSSLIDD